MSSLRARRSATCGPEACPLQLILENNRVTEPDPDFEFKEQITVRRSEKRARRSCGSVDGSLPDFFAPNDRFCRERRHFLKVGSPHPSRGVAGHHEYGNSFIHSIVR